MSTGSFPGVKSGRGVTLTPHSLLVLWLWKSRAVPLLRLWAVRPVQNLSACTRVTFTFHLLHEDQYIFFVISRSVLVAVSSVSNKYCRESQNTRFIFSKFLFVDFVFEIMW